MHATLSWSTSSRRCFHYWSSVSVRHLRQLWMQVTHGLYGNQPMKMPWSHLSNGSRAEAQAISQESWDCSNRGQSKYFMTITCIHTITCRARVCFLTIVLHACSFANGYINTLRMGSAFCGQTKCLLRVRLCPASATFTSAHRIIIMLSPNVGIKSASASAFGLASSGTLWAPSCYLTDQMLNDIAIFLKLYYQGCFKACFWLWGSCCGRRSPSALCGRCLTVAERSTFRRWIGHEGSIAWPIL
jgi:hypothetical protein